MAANVIGESKPQQAGVGASTPSPLPAKAPAATSCNTGGSKAAPKPKLTPVGSQSQAFIFNSWAGKRVEKHKIPKAELRKQRNEAAEGKDYEPEWEDVMRFKSERLPVAEPTTKSYACMKCGRTFCTSVGLTNHEKWHTENQYTGKLLGVWAIQSCGSAYYLHHCSNGSGWCVADGYDAASGREDH